MKDFTQFTLGSSIHRGISAMGWDEPRPIQSQTIPAVLEGRDVLGLAQTGTGKTAAFALPILERLSSWNEDAIHTLVIAPTRELAMQIDVEFQALAKFTNTKTLTVYGGVSMLNQIEALKKHPHVVVACPGRLLDLIQQGVIQLDRVETLVLDEADRLFDMGFLPDIRKIIARLPKKRQNLLWSATMPREIRKLANDILVEPHVVELARTSPADTISHALYPVARERKARLLDHLIKNDSIRSAIIFTRTKFRARKLAMQLSKKGRRAIALQGNMSQAQRDHAMGGFRKGRYDILVATDIASRGIDVAQVSHVVNFDVPDTPEAYTHRIGRTGRAERTGKAYTFFTNEDNEVVRDIEKKIGYSIRREIVEGFGDVPAGNGNEPEKRIPRPPKKKSYGHGHGARPSSSSSASNGGGSPWHRKRRQRALSSR